MRLWHPWAVTDTQRWTTSRPRHLGQQSLQGVYALLKRLNMVGKSARSVNPNANPAQQATCKKSLVREGQTVLPPHVPIELAAIRFQDNMRIGQRGRQMWQWVSCCLLQIPRPGRSAGKPSAWLCRQAGMLCSYLTKPGGIQP